MNTHLYDIALSLLYRTRLHKALVLIEHYGSAQEAWEHLDEPLMEQAWQQALHEYEWIQAHAIQVWTLNDKQYPYRLRQCPDRPIVLYSKGNVNPSDQHMLSVVGTRRPSERGKELTDALVRSLAEQLDNITIVSGGAYGIDIAAHRAALQYGLPTIIIPAHGLDRIYPSQHRPEAIAALEKGGLLTEQISGTEPIAPYFVQRNRIVAGLADAVVVVESQNKGGSLITARMANDYSRELFAFPGRPTDALSEGCNNLIRDHKAALINSADDLIRAMNWQPKHNKQQPIQTQLTGLLAELTPLQQQIINKLQEAEEGLHSNLIVMETAINYSEVAAELVMLEIQGLVKALPGGIYRLVR